jgi:ABC-type spermidine/putrescine transport system permease subunit I
MAYNWPFGAALSVILLAAALVVMALAATLQRRSRL